MASALRFTSLSTRIFKLVVLAMVSAPLFNYIIKHYMQFVNCLYINALQCHYKYQFLWVGVVKSLKVKHRATGGKKRAKNRIIKIGV